MFDVSHIFEGFSISLCVKIQVTRHEHNFLRVYFYTSVLYNIL